MTDLPAAQRADIVAVFLPPLLTEVRSQQADAGQTVKTLWRTHDGALVESVLMRYPGRATVCISSQAGCGMNCPFCATGQAGLTRNLSTAEMVEQVHAAARAIRDQVAPGDPDVQARRLTNVVFMGMGEALANYRSAVAALHRLVDRPPHGMGLSARAVTVSTVGLVPAIDRLAAEPGLGVRLALSLHAPDDELRDELVPVNARWGVAEALDAAYRYYQAVGQRVSIEYALIRDTNDQAWRADLLGKLLNRRGTSLGCRTSSSPGCGPAAFPQRCVTPVAGKSTEHAGSWRRPPDAAAARSGSLEFAGGSQVPQWPDAVHVTHVTKRSAWARKNAISR